MAEFKFPSNDFQSGAKLLSNLGSYWSGTYQGRKQVITFAESRGQLEQQVLVDLLELIASLSRYTVPVFHKDLWHQMDIRESERNDAQTSLARFGEDYVFGPQENGCPIFYGRPVGRDDSSWPAPDRLREVNVIVNRITNPSVVLHKNVDFVFDEVNQALVFRDNLFENDLFVKRSIFENGEITDQEIGLWLFYGDFDLQDVFIQFAHVIGLRLQSSEGYRDLMNAIWDAYVGGTAKEQLEDAFAAISGIPLTTEPQETVEVVETDASHLLIVTDKHSYRFNINANPLVAVGDTLQAGDSLIDAFEIIEINRGVQNVAGEELNALALGRGFLVGGFFGDLVFHNATVELVVEDASAATQFKTKVSWVLDGFPTDVTKFFDLLHQSGVDVDETLANLLDTRTNPTSEPTAADLPATINPLGFIIENVLRNNAFIIRLKIAGFGTRAIGINPVSLLRRIIPPHTTMIVLIEVSLSEDSVTIDNLDDADLDTFTGAEPLIEDIEVTSVEEGALIAYVVSGTCQ